MSSGWADGVDEVVRAAADAEHAGLDLDQLFEELAVVLETTLPGSCAVTRAARGSGPLRRLQVQAGRDSLLCERRPDGTWTTSIALLHGNVVGQARPVPAAVWVRTLRQRLRERAREQGELANQLRGLLGE
jgi:hypothetical protein